MFNLLDTDSDGSLEAEQEKSASKAQHSLFKTKRNFQKQEAYSALNKGASPDLFKITHMPTLSSGEDSSLFDLHTDQSMDASLQLKVPNLLAKSNHFKARTTD